MNRINGIGDRALLRQGGIIRQSAAGLLLEIDEGGLEMMDLIFVGVIVAIYAVMHGIVVAFARLGRIE